MNVYTSFNWGETVSALRDAVWLAAQLEAQISLCMALGNYKMCRIHRRIKTFSVCVNLLLYHLLSFTVSVAMYNQEAKLSDLNMKMKILKNQTEELIRKQEDLSRTLGVILTSINIPANDICSGKSVCFVTILATILLSIHFLYAPNPTQDREALCKKE